MLEEMIRKGRTDITLRYNTNASNIKFKDYDLLDMWKHFKKIELSCSVDHYGERAEWLRSGTDWGVVESNLLRFRNLDYVSFQMNTVFSIFNYSTIGEFYQYLKDKGIIRREDWYHSLYLAVHPSYYSAKSLPKELKIEAAEKALSWAKANEGDGTSLSRLVNDAVNFAADEHTWAANKPIFLQHTASIDRIRDESFWKTFPELNKLKDATE
jgi:sulfatase maturation enzyme AslB (radical SAM superfamily)